MGTPLLAALTRAVLVHIFSSSCLPTGVALVTHSVMDHSGPGELDTPPMQPRLQGWPEQPLEPAQAPGQYQGQGQQLPQMEPPVSSVPPLEVTPWPWPPKKKPPSPTPPLVHRIVYIKLHSTGSSTLTAILHRLCSTYKLNCFVHPLTDWPGLTADREKLTSYLGYLHYHHISLDVWPNHAIFCPDLFDQMIPRSTKVSLFRNPLDRIVSSFGHEPNGAAGVYHQLDRMQRNASLTDVCGEEGHRMSEAISLSDFHLLDFVIITEQYDLGLVMMQRKFGWSSADIMYLPLKIHSKDPKLVAAMKDLRDYLSRPWEQLSEVARQVRTVCITGDEAKIYMLAAQRFKQQWFALSFPEQQEVQAEVLRFKARQSAVQACCKAHPDDEYCEFLSQDNPEWVFNHRPGHRSGCSSAALP